MITKDSKYIIVCFWFYIWSSLIRSTVSFKLYNISKSKFQRVLSLTNIEAISCHRLFICYRRMYLSWRGVVTRGRSLHARPLECALQLNVSATSWGRCPAFNLPIAYYRSWRLRHDIRLAFNRGTNNLRIFCVLNKFRMICTSFSCFSFCVFKHIPRPSFVKVRIQP